MRLRNELKLRFDTPIWVLYPELALFDVLLDKNPHFVKLVSKDVLFELTDSSLGRQDSPTVEQVLRAAIYKEIKRLTYRELQADMLDSKICNRFLKLEENQGYSYSVMQKYISKIKEESIRSIIIEINNIAISEGLEQVDKISTDTTNIETNVHYPTNNSLVLDCIETATRLLKKIKKDKKDDDDRLDKQRKEAKKLNYDINNTKKEEMPSLFDPYLSILKDLIFESWGSIRNDSLKNKAKIDKAKIELKAFLPLMIKVYRNAVTLQLKGIKVANADKVFSVFETHTDILVKGQREVEFGHKVLITRGSSNIILDHKVFEGNPSDKELLLPSIVSIKANYNRTPQSTSNDGGFCSNANLEGCKKLGLINIVFTKVTKSLQNIVSIPELEKILKKWRGTTEAVISNLKRGFDLQRVTWEGFEGFCSKVAWSILGYNLRVMVNRMLQ
jgi:IS5 family transposase